MIEKKRVEKKRKKWLKKGIYWEYGIDGKGKGNLYVEWKKGKMKK